MFFFAGSIFLVTFFVFINPTASLKFQKADNCKVIGQLKNYIEQAEKYSILYINFEYEGKQYLGQACSSDLNQARVFDGLGPYRFYYKHDQISCGSDDESFNTEHQNRILLKNQHIKENKLHRFLAPGGSDNSNIEGDVKISISGSSGKRSKKCNEHYQWSNVKIASWVCLPYNFNIKLFMKPQSCYVNFFEGEKAIQNGINREPMKDQYNFPLISYEERAYYPKTLLICVIIFTYYNWILTLNSIFQYTSNPILKILIRNNILIE